jgi:hypothetical protein
MHRLRDRMFRGGSSIEHLIEHVQAERIEGEAL